MKKITITILVASAFAILVTGCVYRIEAPDTNSQPQTSQNDSIQSSSSSSQAEDLLQNAAVSEEQAKKIALQRVPGASNSDIALHPDYEDGRIVYEGTIIYGTMKYDFEIDAASGTVLSWEQESLLDD